MPINEFEAKEAIIFDILQCSNADEVLTKTYQYCDETEITAGAWDNIPGAWTKWKGAKPSTPTKPEIKSFLKAMMNAMTIFDRDVRWFVTCTAKEFADCTPPEKQHLLTSQRGDNLAHHFNYRVARNVRASAIIEALMNSPVMEQKACYTTAFTADVWYKQLEKANYPLGRKCMALLEIFLKSSHWINFCNDQKSQSVILLGGGASSKDRAVCVSVGNQRNANLTPVTQYIVDYSQHMVHETLCSLAPPSFNKPSNVVLEGAVYDFYDLHTIDFHRRKHGKFTWFMLGCTFGNLDEHRFLKALRSASQPGDLFVLGVDTRIQEQLEAECARIAEYYSKSEIIQFFTRPLRDAWSTHGIDTSLIEESLGNADFRFISGPKEFYSDVPDSLTLAVIAKHKALERTVLVSTRYSKPSLISYIQSDEFGFKLVDERCSVGCSYNQLVFQRVT